MVLMHISKRHRCCEEETKVVAWMQQSHEVLQGGAKGGGPTDGVAVSGLPQVVAQLWPSQRCCEPKRVC